MITPTLQEIVTKIPLGDFENIGLLDACVDNTNPYLWKYGCKVNSQNGEDGIIYYLLNKIGTTSRKTVVEMCAGDGMECNSANLILNHGFHGVLFDGNPDEIKKGVAFYTKRAEIDKTIASRLKFANVWITKDNIVDVFQKLEIPEEIDLLVMDIDGNDYWVLQSIMNANVPKYRPRIICVEYQDIIGPVKGLTIPYDPAFNHRNYDCWGGPNYCGASLPAFLHLLDKEYAFVGCEGQGFNGFFVRRDLMNNVDILEMKNILPCFEITKVKEGMKYRWPRTSNMEWVNVCKINIPSTK